MPDKFTWTLQQSFQMPGSNSAPQFWTGQDYTKRIEDALRFDSRETAERWLQVHKHQRTWLRIVQVTEPEVSHESKQK